MKEIFNSNRNFKLWAYTVSHASLLLRSEMKYPDQDEYSDNIASNIDLEFWAVSHIDIPSVLLGVNIREITEKEFPKEIDKDLLMYDMKIFELQSGEFKYYVIAGGLMIGKNKWENQDRIFDYRSNLEHDEVIFSTTPQSL